MTGRVATKISPVAPWCLIVAVVVVELTLSTAASNDERSATSSDTADVGCAAAATEYQHYGDVNGVPPSLIEGKRTSTGKNVKVCTALYPSQSYGASHAIWDHAVLPATPHRSTRPALNIFSVIFILSVLMRAAVIAHFTYVEMLKDVLLSM